METGIAMSTEGEYHHLEESIHELREEVRELRNTRFRPYVSTVGALVTLFLAGLAYVYGLEHRINTAITAIRTDVHELRSYERISVERDEALSNALGADNRTLLDAIVRHDNRHMQEAAVRSRLATEMTTLRDIFMDIHKKHGKEDE
jgi:hypothetical protein